MNQYYKTVDVKKGLPEMSDKLNSKKYFTLPLGTYSRFNLDGKFVNYDRHGNLGEVKNVAHWLRPVSLSEIIEAAAEKSWDAAIKFAEYNYDRNYGDKEPLSKEQYINSLKKNNMKNKKSYWMKSKGGNVASVTFDGSKKPSKKVVEALSTMIDLAFKNTAKPKTYPCPNCQGCGCTTCGGFGYITEQ